MLRKMARRMSCALKEKRVEKFNGQDSIELARRLFTQFVRRNTTRLSALLQGAIRHDKITRFSADGVPKSRDLWHIVKHDVRAVTPMMSGAR